MRLEFLCRGCSFGWGAILDIGGAKEVYACATHGVLSGPAIDRIRDSVIKELVLLDTIALPEEKKLDKITVLPVAPVFAQAIQRIYADKPVSRVPAVSIMSSTRITLLPLTSPIMFITSHTLAF